MIPLTVYVIIANKGKIDDVIKLSMINKTLYHILTPIRMKKYKEAIENKVDNAYVAGYLEYIKNAPICDGYIPHNVLHLVPDNVWDYVINKYDISKYTNTSDCCYIVFNMCRADKLDRLLYMYSKNITIIEPLIMNYAAQYGRLNIIQYIHDNISDKNIGFAFRAAARYGKLDIIKWLYDKVDISNINCAMIYAEEKNHNHVIEYLKSKN